MGLPEDMAELLAQLADLQAKVTSLESTSGQGSSPPPPPAWVAVTVEGTPGSYPKNSGCWTEMEIVGPEGDEVEGSVGSFKPTNNRFRALQLGGTAAAPPPVGTSVIAFSIGGYWVYQWAKG